MNHIAPTQTSTLVNGIDVDRILDVVTETQANASKATFQFRTRNRWLGGTLNRSEIKDFVALGAENTSRTEAFVLDNDEPEALTGADTAPNPVEYYLHALAGCVTTSIVAHAAVRGIEIRKLSAEVEGDLDVRGFLGVVGEVRKGFGAIRVRLRVETDASQEAIRDLAAFSPVFEMVSAAVPTDLDIVIE